MKDCAGCQGGVILYFVKYCIFVVKSEDVTKLPNLWQSKSLTARSIVGLEKLIAAQLASKFSVFCALQMVCGLCPFLGDSSPHCYTYLEVLFNVILPSLPNLSQVVFSLQVL